MPLPTATEGPQPAAPAPATDEVCCPVFDPAPWDGTTHMWHDRLFLQDTVHQVMHVPTDMRAVVTRMMKQVVDAQAMPEPAQFLMLAHDSSAWKSELLISVTKDVPGGTMVRLSGTFFTKVFDGPYHHVPRWIDATDAVLATQGKKALTYYFHYAYCPKCSRRYGHNYCVAFAQVA